MDFAALVAWCAVNGSLNPRAQASQDAFLLANPPKGKAKKERRSLLIRVVGVNEKGETEVYRHFNRDDEGEIVEGDTGTLHESCKNLKDVVSGVKGVMLFQAATIGGLEKVRAQKSFAPSWEDIEDDE